MSHDADHADHAGPTVAPTASISRRPVCYPAEYIWLFGLGSMDLLITGVVLLLGGRELNPVANRVFELAGFSGMVAFKFVLLLLVLLICEYIGRRRRHTGRRLVRVAVAITALPIVAAFAQVVYILAWGMAGMV